MSQLRSGGWPWLVPYSVLMKYSPRTFISIAVIV